MDILKRKILLVSTGDIHGAYEAIFRLASLFESQGHQVAMLVRQKTQLAYFVIQYKPVYQPKIKKDLYSRILYKVKNLLWPPKEIDEPVPLLEDKYSFISKDEATVNISVERVLSQIGFVPEFIYSGMTNDFMNSTDLLNLHKATNAKVFTITVDMNHFTGGCHYAWDCQGYIRGCDEQCPAIIGDIGRDLAKNNFDIKLKNASEGNFQIIPGSGWTLDQAKKSKIYKNQKVFYNINSLINTNLFNEKNRDIAKKVFDFDNSKFYILTGSQSSNDPRKGFAYFSEAFKLLESRLTPEQKSKVVLLVVSNDVPHEFKQLNYEKQKISFVKDYRLLALLYQAIDLYVNVSVEDSGPMMVSEALACGTPVVGFDMGVVNNMVITGYNGYKAILKDSDDLAKGIQQILELSSEEYLNYSKNAVRQVDEFSSLHYAKSVFDEIHKMIKNEE